MCLKKGPMKKLCSRQPTFWTDRKTATLYMTSLWSEVWSIGNNIFISVQKPAQERIQSCYCLSCTCKNATFGIVFNTFFMKSSFWKLPELILHSTMLIFAENSFLTVTAWLEHSFTGTSTWPQIVAVPYTHPTLPTNLRVKASMAHPISSKHTHYVHL